MEFLFGLAIGGLPGGVPGGADAMELTPAIANGLQQDRKTALHCTAIHERVFL